MATSSSCGAPIGGIGGIGGGAGLSGWKTLFASGDAAGRGPGGAPSGELAKAARAAAAASSRVAVARSESPAIVGPSSLWLSGTSSSAVDAGAGDAVDADGDETDDAEGPDAVDADGEDADGDDGDDFAALGSGMLADLSVEPKGDAEPATPISVAGLGGVGFTAEGRGGVGAAGAGGAAGVFGALGGRCAPGAGGAMPMTVGAREVERPNIPPPEGSPGLTEGLVAPGTPGEATAMPPSGVAGPTVDGDGGRGGEAPAVEGAPPPCAGDDAAGPGIGGGGLEIGSGMPELATSSKEGDAMATVDSAPSSSSSSTSSGSSLSALLALPAIEVLGPEPTAIPAVSVAFAHFAGIRPPAYRLRDRPRNRPNPRIRGDLRGRG